MIALAVAGGAALGAPSRYLLDRAIQECHEQRFPWGILVINLLGSGALGLLIGLAEARGLPAAVLAAVGTGWCGAFTTYSTFGYDTLELAWDGFGWRALANVAFSVGGGVAMAALGIALGRALGG